MNLKFQRHQLIGFDYQHISLRLLPSQAGWLVFDSPHLILGTKRISKVRLSGFEVHAILSISFDMKLGSQSPSITRANRL